MSSIRYLTRSAIDDAKWNACVEEAANGLIYGYTFYLDAMCSNWDALVLDDYNAVMPLPWRRKWALYYLYHPFAIAQLGLFGSELSPELLHEFLKNIPSKFRYWDFSLNFKNRCAVPSFPFYERKNYILHLAPSYETIQQHYRLQLKRNIKKAIANKCIVQKDTAVDDVIALAKKQKHRWGTDADFEHFKILYKVLSKQNKAVTYAVTAPDGVILASAVFFFSNNRYYYIFPGNHPSGRTTGASHFLIDQFIKDHSGQNLILDFEGSDVPSLQFFYSSFGAVEEPYVAIRHNCLPWFLKWLKH